MTASTSDDGEDGDNDNNDDDVVTAMTAEDVWTPQQGESAGVVGDICCRERKRRWGILSPGTCRRAVSEKESSRSDGWSCFAKGVLLCGWDGRGGGRWALDARGCGGIECRAGQRYFGSGRGVKGAEGEEKRMVRMARKDDNVLVV